MREFFEDYPTQHPIFAPFQTPIYSNAAFQILAHALENITGQSMEARSNRHLVGRLNLTSTSYTNANTTKNAMIPFNTKNQLAER